MARNGMEVTPDMEQQMVEHESRGQTVVLAAINSEGGMERGMKGGSGWVGEWVGG